MAQQESVLATQTCPYWSDQARNCNLVTDGLYLPVSSFVEVYCEGGNYSSCGRYIDQEAIFGDKVSVEVGGIDMNRRRDPRIPRRFRLQLLDCSNGEQFLDDTMMTVDISRGGMRFESRRSLPQGARILFSLDDEVLSESLQGAGHVQWCQQVDNTMFYHAGVSFSDPSLVSAVRENLIS
jgi:hypothetical protein